jgi:hypothetical protein
MEPVSSHNYILSKNLLTQSSIFVEQAIQTLKGVAAFLHLGHD